MTRHKKAPPPVPAGPAQIPLQRRSVTRVDENGLPIRAAPRRTHVARVMVGFRVTPAFKEEMIAVHQHMLDRGEEINFSQACEDVMRLGIQTYYRNKKGSK